MLLCNTFFHSLSSYQESSLTLIIQGGPSIFSKIQCGAISSQFFLKCHKIHPIACPCSTRLYSKYTHSLSMQHITILTIYWLWVWHHMRNTARGMPWPSEITDWTNPNKFSMNESHQSNGKHWNPKFVKIPNLSSLSATKVAIMLPPMRKKSASVYDNSLFAATAILNKTRPMMTSSTGNIFHVTGPLCREFTVHRWIPHTKASELWSFLWSVPWINGWVNNRKAGDLRHHHSHYDIIVMRPQTPHNVLYWPYCILISHWPSKWFHPKLAINHV